MKNAIWPCGARRFAFGESHGVPVGRGTTLRPDVTEIRSPGRALILEPHQARPVQLSQEQAGAASALTRPEWS